MNNPVKKYMEQIQRPEKHKDKKKEDKKGKKVKHKNKDLDQF